MPRLSEEARALLIPLQTHRKHQQTAHLSLLSARHPAPFALACPCLTRLIAESRILARANSFLIPGGALGCWLVCVRVPGEVQLCGGGGRRRVRRRCWVALSCGGGGPSPSRGRRAAGSVSGPAVDGTVWSEPAGCDAPRLCTGVREL